MPSAPPASLYQSPKCFVTYGSMGHIDPNQVPHKSKPWSNVMSLKFIHKIDLIIPQEIYDVMHRKLAQEQAHPCYFKVNMTLEQVLSGSFFTEYIKRGNICMLSEGTRTVDNHFTLSEGVLTMYLEKELYERAGLVGKPQGAKGNRGLKPRWVVSYDLRSPSMLHGKKGFDRLVYACKKVLNQPLTWLCNTNEGPTPSPDPFEQHFGTKYTSSPGIVSELEVAGAMPSIPQQVLADGDRQDLEMTAAELYEWLSLIRLESPRVNAGDKVDSYLSRYQVPQEGVATLQLCKLTWQGLISAHWLRQTLIALLSNCPTDSWFCLSATEFSRTLAKSSDEMVMLRPNGSKTEYLLMEIKAPE